MQSGVFKSVGWDSSPVLIRKMAEEISKPGREQNYGIDTQRETENIVAEFFCLQMRFSWFRSVTRLETRPTLKLAS